MDLTLSVLAWGHRFDLVVLQCCFDAGGHVDRLQESVNGTVSFGIASLVTIIARELLRWKQDRFRFSILTLLVLMTELAILFGLLALL